MSLRFFERRGAITCWSSFRGGTETRWVPLKKLGTLSAGQKLAASAGIILVVVAIGATALRWGGFVGSFNSKTAGALVGALAALAVKWILQGLVADDHTYYRQGYDLCIMTLSTALTAFVAVFSLIFFGDVVLDYLLKQRARNFGVIALLAFIGDRRCREHIKAHRQEPKRGAQQPDRICHRHRAIRN